MAVYTCYDMIRDCQANRPDGWLYLVESFVVPLETLVRHYGGDHGTLETLLLRLKSDRSPFQGMPMLHQREFLFHLRPLVLETTASAAPESPPNWEAVTAALAPLSATERQAAWLETFGYNAAQTAVLMRMAPDTVAALRTRSAELLRGGLDDWAAGMLRTHGRSLGAAIEASAPPAEPLEFRHFLDVIDGRITWARRTQFERALEASWHEVHKACAIREVDQALSHPHPLADPQRYFDVLGVAKPKAGFLERLARRALHS